MSGFACIRLCLLGRATAASALAFSQTQSRSVHSLYSASIMSRQLMSLALPPAIHRSSVFGQDWQDGSWNVALDARRARWLQGRHSTWLLFGVCSSIVSAGAFGMLALSEAVTNQDDNDYDLSFVEVEGEDNPAASHGKPIFKKYTVTGIPGDGRCLFRAVAHGACLREGKNAPSDSRQRMLADELRDKVVDELILQRAETEWFIEGDFDEYTQRMRERHVWGGEPELLMLSHILKMPITVYMPEKNSKGLIAIAEYGQEYGKGQPIRVLYNGFGHYDALQLHGDS